MYHFNVIFISRRYARWINKEIIRCIEGIGEGEIVFVCSCFVVYRKYTHLMRVFKLSIYFKYAFDQKEIYIIYVNTVFKECYFN